VDAEQDAAFNRMVRHPVGHAVGYGLGMLVTFNYVALGWVLFATGLRASFVVYGAPLQRGARAHGREDRGGLL